LNAPYRIPDVLLCPKPLPKGKVGDIVPWAIIEILSPEDSMQEQLERFRDYAQIGAGVMVLLDPKRMVSYRFEGLADPDGFHADLYSRRADAV
jgi:Uma2 family endonuclease